MMNVKRMIMVLAACTLALDGQCLMAAADVSDNPGKAAAPGVSAAERAVTADKESRHQAFLDTVRATMDDMIKNERSPGGDGAGPLFPIVLDRKTREIPAKTVANLYTARVCQEFKSTANPLQDMNLYQVLYALTAITGENRYAVEADRVLGCFLKKCQETKYGFYCWGEHLGWDLVENAPGGFPPAQAEGYMIHEFYRPWIFWSESLTMAPEPAMRFARALWRYQVDHTGGKISFSRHAMLAKPDGPNRRSYEFPRHGGFYIAAWAAAFEKTKDKEMLEAIEALVGFYEARRDPHTGAIPHGSNALELDRDGKKGENFYPPSNLSLAVDLHDAAAKLPEPLKSRMLKLATSIDKSVLALAHDPGPGGKGFVVFADPTTLRPTEYWIYKEDLEKGKPPRRIPYTGGWRSAYIGQYPHTKVTPAMMLRYAQTGNKDYRRLLLACADNFLTSEPDLKPQKDANGKPLPLPDVEAGTIGSVMELLNWAYRETKEAKYLDRSVWFGEWALSHYWTDGLPLPRATVRENIYSAPSRSDTLVMALLDAWMLANPTAKTYPLIPTDR